VANDDPFDCSASFDLDLTVVIYPDFERLVINWTQAGL